MRLLLATLATLGVLVAIQLAIGLIVQMAVVLSFHSELELIPVPEMNVWLLHAQTVAIVTLATAVGGLIGGRRFLPIAAFIALGLFALAIYALLRIATPVEPLTFGSILSEVWPSAVLPVSAAVLGAWAGQLLAARKIKHVGNEI